MMSNLSTNPSSISDGSPGNNMIVITSPIITVEKNLRFYGHQRMVENFSDRTNISKTDITTACSYHKMIFLVRTFSTIAALSVDTIN